jgi:hypothetical protein
MFALNQETLDTLMTDPDRFDFAVVVLARDDLIFESDPRSQAPRDNANLAIGILVGRLGKSRTFIVTGSDSPATLPTDVAGLIVARFSEKRAEINLAVELEAVSASIGAAIRHLGPLRDRPAEHYSCFISHSIQDRPFVERLYRDLERVGIRSWLDTQDIRPGADWESQVHQALSAHDKLLVVLSQSSIQSPLVRYEVERARELEQKTKRTVLFPIRIDDAVFRTPTPLSEMISPRMIGDFEHWQDSESYKRAFSRLVKDLTVSTAAESKTAL